MTVRIIALGVIGFALFAQTRSSSDINALTHDIRSAIEKDDFTAAGDLAVKLDDAVEQQFHAWLIRDASQRVDEVLNWLPEDTESLMVYQDPFAINSKDSLRDFDGNPGRLYTSDRLMALNGGKLYSGLAGVTVRLVAAGLRRIRNRSSGSETMTPALMPDSEAVYFYFLADPPETNILGRPDQTIEDRPVWLGTATLDAGAPIGTRVRPTREDTTWLAFASQSLLVMSSSPELLQLILKRIRNGSQTRALPDTLPEWAEVDRRADFWGLRHYSDLGDGKDSSNPRSTTNPRLNDPTAVGVTVRFNAGTKELDVRYLSGAAQLPRFIDGPPTPQFKSDHVRGGLWRVTSNIEERGDYPFHVAARLLGFGEYR